MITAQARRPRARPRPLPRFLAPGRAPPAPLPPGSPRVPPPPLSLPPIAGRGSHFQPAPSLARISAPRGRSSVGRASRSQREGRGFDSLRLHQYKLRDSRHLGRWAGSGAWARRWAVPVCCQKRRRASPVDEAPVGKRGTGPRQPSELSESSSHAAVVRVGRASVHLLTRSALLGSNQGRPSEFVRPTRQESTDVGTRVKQWGESGSANLGESCTSTGGSDIHQVAAGVPRSIEEKGPPRGSERCSCSVPFPQSLETRCTPRLRSRLDSQGAWALPLCC